MHAKGAIPTLTSSRLWRASDPAADLARLTLFHTHFRLPACFKHRHGWLRVARPRVSSGGRMRKRWPTGSSPNVRAVPPDKATQPTTSATTFQLADLCHDLQHSNMPLTWAWSRLTANVAQQMLKRPEETWLNFYGMGVVPLVASPRLQLVLRSAPFSTFLESNSATHRA